MPPGAGHRRDDHSWPTASPGRVPSARHLTLDRGTARLAVRSRQIS
jgi:hypothetical protein